MNLCFVIWRSKRANEGLKTSTTWKADTTRAGSPLTHHSTDGLLLQQEYPVVLKTHSYSGDPARAGGGWKRPSQSRRMGLSWERVRRSKATLESPIKATGWILQPQTSSAFHTSSSPIMTPSILSTSYNSPMTVAQRKEANELRKVRCISDALLQKQIWIPRFDSTWILILTIFFTDSQTTDGEKKARSDQRQPRQAEGSYRPSGRQRCK